MGALAGDTQPATTNPTTHRQTITQSRPRTVSILGSEYRPFPMRAGAVVRLSVVAAIAVALPACSSKKPEAETPRAALERLAPSIEGSVPAPADPPGAYRITFDRINAASAHAKNGDFVPERLERTVARPFVSGVKNQTQRRLGFEQDSPSGSERAVFLRPLPEEPRPDVYTPAADHDDQKNRRVAGRNCRVYLYDADEYCVDGAGLVLASRVGDTVEVARTVELLGETPTPEEIAATLAKGISGKTIGSVRPLAADSSPPGRTDWSLPAAPDGFTFVGRYASVPLTSEVLDENSQGQIAGIVDVYVRGIDSIVVDRGGKLDLGAISDKDLGTLSDAKAVELGALGQGKSGIGGIGPFGYRQVDAFPERNRYVVVAGTVPKEQLVEIARALRPEPGTTLRYLDE